MCNFAHVLLVDICHINYGYWASYFFEYFCCSICLCGCVRCFTFVFPSGIGGSDDIRFVLRIFGCIKCFSLFAILSASWNFAWTWRIKLYMLKYRFILFWNLKIHKRGQLTCICHFSRLWGFISCWVLLLLAEQMHIICVLPYYLLFPNRNVSSFTFIKLPAPINLLNQGLFGVHLICWFHEQANYGLYSGLECGVFVLPHTLFGLWHGYFNKISKLRFWSFLCTQF